MAPVRIPEARSLALQAVQRLRRVAASFKLAEGPAKIWFDGCLDPSLAEFELWLHDDAGHIDETTIIGVLSLLQAICECDPKRKVYAGSSLEERFAKLFRLTRASLKETTTSLQYLLSDTRIAAGTNERESKRRAFGRRLDRLTGDIAAAAESGVVEPLVSRSDEDDFAAHANALCDVLSRYGRCQDEDIEVDIVPKVSLSGYRKHPKSGSAFDVLFPDHPHQQGEGLSCQWQNTVIQVPLDVKTRGNLDEFSGEGQIDYHEFCGTISRLGREQLFLTVSKKRLYAPPTAQGGGSDKLWMWTADDSKSIPLREILESGDLLQSKLEHLKMKNILLYLIAKGVWQFYESQLMNDQWTKDSVEFLFEHRQRNGESTVGIFLNQPLVSARTACPTLKNGSVSDMIVLSHAFPKIRELGIMLLEIVLGQGIDSFRSKYPQFLKRGQPSPSGDLLIARRLYEERVKRDDKLFRPIRDAIGKCLDDQAFKAMPKDRGNPNFVRENIYEKVVRPLESVLHFYDDRDDVDPIIMSPQPGSTKTGKLHSGYTKHGIVREPKHQGNNTSRNKTGLHDSENWFDKMDQLNVLLRPTARERDPKYENNRVKIAVLDTGIVPDLWCRDEGSYRDFVDGQDQHPQDGPGHGTNTVRLLYKVFENPVIYVARVFERQEADESTPARVAGAVGWARENEVDIIVMALGFSSSDDGIKRQVLGATGDGILVFAGAGNCAGHDKVAFPANLISVMCIFATDPANKNSRELNPPPRRRAANFAILGDGVQLDGEEVILRGTSIAAAIAAGVAGSLLDFSRQPICRTGGGCGERLDIQGYDEMQNIFTKLSEDWRDGEYDCIIPWHLMRNLPDNGDREAQRRKIRDTLLDWASG
ncbi:hypothetical protein OQA88_5885 [Cercophora sp. LCS_1]